MSAIKFGSGKHRGDAPQNINATSERGPASPGRVIYSGRTQVSKVGDNSETLILFRPTIIKREQKPNTKGTVQDRQG